MSTTNSIPEEIEIVNIAAKSWQKQVFDRFKGQCANCGGIDHLSSRLIIPMASGGLETPSNGVLLCRPCDLASTASASHTPPETRLVNFWVSRELYAFMQGPTGFTGMGALIRALLDKYVEDPERFEDLAQYQDDGSDVKVNVWADCKKYVAFKAILDKNGMTVTQAFKSLLKMYQENKEL